MPINGLSRTGLCWLVHALQRDCKLDFIQKCTLTTHYAGLEAQGDRRRVFAAAVRIGAQLAMEAWEW